MRSALVLVLLTILAWSAASAQPQPTAVAVVVRVNGAVQVHPRAGVAAVRAAPGMQLHAGARVVVPTGANALVLYRTGRSQTLTRTTTIRAPAAAPRTGVFQQTVRTLRDISQTDARTQPNRQGMIRPVAGAPVPIAPRNGLGFSHTRPIFQWFAVDGATGYLLQIRDLGTSEILRFSSGPDTSFVIPDAQSTLSQGHRYEWTVATADGGRAAMTQQFWIASQAQADSLQERIEALQAAGLDPDDSGLFIAAMVYRDFGLFYEAAERLNRMEDRGDGFGRAYHQLRGEVYDRLGWLDAAAEAFAAADAEPGG